MPHMMISRSLLTGIFAFTVALTSFCWNESVKGQATPPWMLEQMKQAQSQQSQAAPKESSIGTLQALLYDNTLAVARFDLARIDYAMLSTFVDDSVEKGIGSIQTNDDYLKQLRESQKSQLKDSIKRLINLAQTSLNQSFQSREINEFFLIMYGNASERFTILAIPTQGKTNAAKDAMITYFNNIFSPITLFERFGFLVVLLDHSNSVDPQAQEYRQEVRKEVLPKIRRQFSSAAQTEAGPFFRALNQVNGTAFSLILSPEFIRLGVLEPSQYSKELDRLGQSQELSQELTAPIQAVQRILQNADELLSSLDPELKSYEWGSISLSLVGSPKLVVWLHCVDEATAQAITEKGKVVLTGVQAGIPALLQSFLANYEGSDQIAFSQMLDPLFAALMPQTKGNEVAFLLDLGIVKDHVDILIPLSGGVSSQEAERNPEEDEINWDIEPASDNASGDPAEVSTDDAATLDDSTDMDTTDEAQQSTEAAPAEALDDTAAPDDSNPSSDESAPEDEIDFDEEDF